MAQALSNLTPQTFAEAVLSQLGLPQTPSNIQAMVAWQKKEGGNWQNTARYNPLNTTLRLPGSTVMSGGNSAGVQSYTSWDQGVQATAETLRLPNYSGIRQALAQSAGCGALSQAVANSPWGTGSFAQECGSSYNPTSSGQPQGSNVASTPQGCAMQLPFGICLLSNAQVQDLQNILIIGAGGVILLVGGLIVVISALGSSGAGRKAKTVAQAANMPAVVVRGTVRGGARATGAVQKRQADRETARNRESYRRQRSQPPRRIENPLGTRQANRARVERSQRQQERDRIDRALAESKRRQREAPKYDYSQIPF